MSDTDHCVSPVVHTSRRRSQSMPSFGRVQVSWSCTQVPDFGGGAVQEIIVKCSPPFQVTS